MIQTLLIDNSRSNSAARGRLSQIVERLLALSRMEGIAHTQMARQLQQDARDLADIVDNYLP